MKLKIINETGVTKHTQIITESGEDISKYVKSLILRFNLGQVVTAEVELIRMGVDVIAELKEKEAVS